MFISFFFATIEKNKLEVKMRSLKSLFMLSILATTSVFAADSSISEKCNQSFKTGSTLSGLRYCKQACNQDNVKQQDLLNYGKLLLKGSGRNPPQPEEAFLILLKAAEKNNVAAFYNLGNISYQKRDFTSALNFYSKALEYNHPGAIYKLGYLYQEGKGTDLNLKKAFDMYQKSANLGDPHAMSALRDMYSLGTVVFNVKESYFWALAASENGDYSAKSTLNVYAKRLSSEEQDIQNNRLISWEKELGNPEEKCQELNLADSPDAAFGFCLRAANYSSNPNIYNILGNLYQSDILSRLSDDIEAFRWLLKAADNGSISACYEIGLYYAKKIHSSLIKTDYTQAINYYTKAANKNHQNAALELGIIYDKGLGVKEDKASAIEWYTKSALLGNEEAAYHLGILQIKNKNYKEAALWLGIADKWGYRTAHADLNRAENKLSNKEKEEVTKKMEQFLQNDLE